MALRVLRNMLGNMNGIGKFVADSPKNKSKGQVLFLRTDYNAWHWEVMSDAMYHQMTPLKNKGQCFFESTNNSTRKADGRDRVEEDSCPVG